jgi:hypothetical protein
MDIDAANSDSIQETIYREGSDREETKEENLKEITSKISSLAKKNGESSHPPIGSIQALILLCEEKDKNNSKNQEELNIFLIFGWTDQKYESFHNEGRECLITKKNRKEKKIGAGI